MKKTIILIVLAILLISCTKSKLPETDIETLFRDSSYYKEVTVVKKGYSFPIKLEKEDVNTFFNYLKTVKSNCYLYDLLKDFNNENDFIEELFRDSYTFNLINGKEIKTYQIAIYNNYCYVIDPLCFYDDVE